MSDVNQKYRALCAEMGHLQFNLEKITLRMKDIRAEVANLEEIIAKANQAGKEPVAAADEKKVE